MHIKATNARHPPAASASPPRPRKDHPRRPLVRLRYMKSLQKATPRKATTESHDSLTLTLATSPFRPRATCRHPIRSNRSLIRHLDVATVVFSHVQCVKTRHSLARVSKLWREASKPAAAYPLRFDFERVPGHAFLDAESSHHRHDGQRRSSVSTLRESRWTSW